jgi:hypothetical protein
MYKLFAVLFFLLVIGCKQTGTIRKNESLKDSLVRRYLSVIDSIGFYDTTIYDFKLLKAYIHDDTQFFFQMKRDLDRRSDYVYPAGLDSCVLPTKLSDLPVDMAYRFIHSQSFCDFGQVVTITRSGDSIQLHYADYILGGYDGRSREIILENGTHYSINSDCKLVKQFDKSLRLGDWEELETAVNRTDYWGLSSLNPRGIMDGSYWQVDAYTKQPLYFSGKQIHSVSRQSPSLEAFRRLGFLFMKLAGEKGMCDDLF